MREVVRTQMAHARHEHGALTPLICHATISVARTWRLHATGCVAGEPATLALHCGQVVSSLPARIVVEVVPLQPRGLVSTHEQLRHPFTLRDATKGEVRDVRFGPVCAAGPHLLSVTLNKAHIVGSPLQLFVRAAEPAPARSQVQQSRAGQGRAGHSRAQHSTA